MPYFYEDDYEPQRCPRPSPDFSCDLSSPVAIYNWLNDRVYKQDDWKRAASLILYNHINHIFIILKKIIVKYNVYYNFKKFLD